MKPDKKGKTRVLLRNIDINVYQQFQKAVIDAEGGCHSGQQGRVVTELMAEYVRKVRDSSREHTGRTGFHAGVYEVEAECRNQLEEWDARTKPLQAAKRIRTATGYTHPDSIYRAVTYLMDMGLIEPTNKKELRKICREVVM